MPRRYRVHVAQVIDEVVRAHGHRPALRWSADRATSFEALDRYSNRIARLLLQHGVRKRDTIGLCVEKSLTAYAAIPACLKVGAPYFVIDPANPPARTRAMTDRCRPALAIIAPSVDKEVFDCPTLVSSAAEDDAGEPWLEAIADRPVDVPWTIDGSDPAYVMFTSGSTGVPKGVTISHGNLLNFIHWSQEQLQTRPTDVFTNLNPLFFDNSVFDIYASLFAGASLVPCTAAMMTRPREVIARIEALGCTIYFSVPSLLIYFQTLKLIDRSSFPALRTIVFGGEGYPKPMLAKLHASLGDRIELLNVYGPTECTCICSAYRITDADFVDLIGYPPLGTLIPSFSSVVISETGVPAEAGTVGELCLGGPCVGLGYFGDPAQTARAFIQNPTHDKFIDRMYRTGDLVRVDPVDGKLHFVGRADTQIKHQGYRIELGEIEHALTAIDGVVEAAALYLPIDGASRIVAFAASCVIDVRGIKEALSRSLPRYMLPDRVIVVRELMKNANGKIDRQGMATALSKGRS